MCVRELCRLWGGGSGRLEDDFFQSGWVAPNGKGQIFLGESDSAMKQIGSM